MSIPQSVDELTPEFLTRALTGVRGDEPISSVRAEDIGTGVGVFGIITRLHLTGGGPTTLIAKFPTDAEANRQVGLALGLYEREHRFYTSVADTVPFPVPQCYYSAADSDAGEYLILMEDLGHLEMGDQLAGLTLGRAEVLVDAIAAFHATWWDSPELDQLQWLPRQDDPVYVAQVPAIVSAGVSALGSIEDDLPPGSLELARRVDASFVDLIHRCAAGPRTFVHGDMRLDNVFFQHGTDDFALIDWQLALRCRGVYDVVWLLATSMNVLDQDRYAVDLLHRYHRALNAHGVSWSESDLRTAAAEQAAYLLSGPLSLIGTFDFSQAGDGRAAELTRKWVARGFNLALLYGGAEIV